MTACMPFCPSVPPRRRAGSVLQVLFGIALLLTGIRVQAEARVQVVDGQFEAGQGVLFDLPGLRAGQTLQFHARATSGSLDPFLAVLKPGLDVNAVRHAYRERYQQLLAGRVRDPAAYAALLDDFALVHDDDSGQGYAAALGFTVPADGDYRLLLIASPLRPGDGGYRLLIGSDAPEVLAGRGTASGAPFVGASGTVWGGDARVQASDVGFASGESWRYVELRRVHAGETLQLALEPAGAAPLPALLLLDYGDKPLAVARPTADGRRLVLEYRFAAADEHPRLRLDAAPGTAADAAYRLLLGIDAPGVLEGRVPPGGRPVLREPIAVQVGVRMDQITGVDQRGENFGVVASLMLDWVDPELAFNPESCGCRYLSFSGDAFAQYVQQHAGRWPEFVLFNQQGNRWSQKRSTVLHPDGHVQYFERFSATLQAPDFDFRRFPFDTQRFFIRVELVAPDWLYRFTELPGYSGTGHQLGEEEWVTRSFDTRLTTETETTGVPVSRYSFGFTADRHLNYYMYRIFLPVLVIIVIAWVTLFLRDYGKRVEVAGGNLLLFIAFNFTISSDLPRLGYLSFLDTLLLSAFVVTGCMFVLAVYMRRLEADGATDVLRRIDGWVIWLYPVAYTLGIGAIAAIYR